MQSEPAMGSAEKGCNTTQAWADNWCNMTSTIWRSLESWCNTSDAILTDWCNTTTNGVITANTSGMVSANLCNVSDVAPGEFLDTASFLQTTLDIHRKSNTARSLSAHEHNISESDWLVDACGMNVTLCTLSSMCGAGTEPVPGMEEPANSIDYAEHPVSLAVLGLWIVSGLLGNASIITATLSDRKLRRVENAFHFNLAVADICALLNYGLRIVAYVTRHALIHRVVVKVFCVLFSLLAVCNIFCIIQIVIFRVIRLRQLNSQLTKRKVGFLVTVTWALGLFVALLDNEFGRQPLPVCRTEKVSHGWLIFRLGLLIVLVSALVITYVICVQRLRALRMVEPGVSPLEKPVVHYRAATSQVVVQFSNISVTRNANGESHTSAARPSVYFMYHRQLVVTSTILLSIWVVTVALPVAVTLNVKGRLADFTMSLLMPLMSLNNVLTPVVYVFRHAHFRRVLSDWWRKSRQLCQA